jgi:hypothetical protein
LLWIWLYRLWPGSLEAMVLVKPACLDLLGLNLLQRYKDSRMECFVYILGSFGKDGYRTYVGWTNDLDRRLAQHNAGTGARPRAGGFGSCCMPSSARLAAKR